MHECKLELTNVCSLTEQGFTATSDHGISQLINLFVVDLDFRNEELSISDQKSHVNSEVYCRTKKKERGFS